MRLRWSLNLAGNADQQFVSHESCNGTGRDVCSLRQDERHLLLPDEGCALFTVTFPCVEQWVVGAEWAALGDDMVLRRMREEGAAEHDLRLQTTFLGCLYLHGDQRIIKDVARTTWEATGTPDLVDTKYVKNVRGRLEKYAGHQRRIDRVRFLLKRDGFLRSDNGSRRDFFGRKDALPTVQEALAWNPRAMVAYVTGLAWRRLVAMDGLKVPLVTPPTLWVQCAKETKEATRAMLEAFTVDVAVAGQQLKLKPTYEPV